MKISFNMKKNQNFLLIFYINFQLGRIFSIRIIDSPLHAQNPITNSWDVQIYQKNLLTPDDNPYVAVKKKIKDLFQQNLNQVMNLKWASTIYFRWEEKYALCAIFFLFCPFLLKLNYLCTEIISKTAIVNRTREALWHRFRNDD